MSEQNGKWTAAEDAAQHRNYVFGDRKSIEMLQAFKNDLQGRGVSLNDMSSQCDEFEKALETLMSLPGDWHTGLNMIVSIFKCFYDPLLKPIQSLLDWKRINDKVSKCYYQANRLVQLSNEELHQFLIHQFVADNWEEYKAMFNDADVQNDDVLCRVADNYRQYLLELTEDAEGDRDEFLVVCANFFADDR